MANTAKNTTKKTNTKRESEKELKLADIEAKTDKVIAKISKGKGYDKELDDLKKAVADYNHICEYEVYDGCKTAMDYLKKLDFNGKGVRIERENGEPIGVNVYDKTCATHPVSFCKRKKLPTAWTCEAYDLYFRLARIHADLIGVPLSAVTGGEEQCEISKKIGKEHKEFCDGVSEKNPLSDTQVKKAMERAIKSFIGDDVNFKIRNSDKEFMDKAVSKWDIRDRTKLKVLKPAGFLDLFVTVAAQCVNSRSYEYLYPVSKK